VKKLINICGTARCGSTMVDLILGNDDRGFSLGEVHAWFRPFRTHHFKMKCSCKGSNCPWDRLIKFKEEDFYRNAFNILDVDFLIDSSKNLSWVIDNNISAQRNGIQVYNLLLFKEPISFFHSFWKRGFSINKVRKNNYIKYYNQCFKSGLPLIAINYNKFTANPRIALIKLCDLLGIPYFEGKENFWEKQHHHLFGSMGIRKQVEKENSTIIAKESFPQEYEKLIPKIENDNNKNKDFQHVITKLKAHEMKTVGYTNFSKKIKKPYWYYLSKLKQKFRQKFPEKWECEQ